MLTRQKKQQLQLGALEISRGVVLYGSSLNPFKRSDWGGGNLLLVYMYGPRAALIRYTGGLPLA
jgi:hypothetical protein